MNKKSKIQLAHIAIAILGLILVILQTKISVIIGILLLSPSLMFLSLMIITLDFGFAKDHYKKIFRVPE